MSIERIFRKIAAENGISVSELKNEMQKAIDEGLKNPAPRVQEYWKKVPYKGNKPTPEDVIAFTTGNIKI